MFQYKKSTVALIFLGAQLLLSAGSLHSTPVNNGPAKVEPTENKEINKITLTPKAVERLDLKTTAVTEDQIPAKNGSAKGNGKKKIVPYSSVIYDIHGQAWVYVSPQPLVFYRQPITIDFIEGDKVVLIEGPPTGTKVVMTGVAELYGAEKGIGK
jgi:hypothetical protein